MFKKIACVIACCLLLVGGLSGPVLAQGQDNQQDDRAGVDLVRRFVNDILVIHPELASAEAALNVAEARERSANRPLYNPDLEFDAEKATDRTYEIGISQTVDWAGKKNAAYAASGAKRRAAEVEYIVTRNVLTSRVLNLLSEYWSAVELARLASSSVDLMHDFAQQAKSRYDAGDMMQVEYETAVLAYTEVRMRQADIVASLAGVIRELTTLGAIEDVRMWPRMPNTLPTLTILPGDAEQLVAALPEVEAANALVAAATAEVDLAKLLKKPDPTFGIRAGTEDDELLIGVSFSIPIYVRNNFSEDVLASLALRSQAEADAATTERDARARLLVAMERYMTMREAWKVWEESGASSIDRRTAALQILWEAREISISEFLLQVRQTLETQSTAMELRATLWKSWIEYLNSSSQVVNWLNQKAVAPEIKPEKITMRKDR